MTEPSTDVGTVLYRAMGTPSLFEVVDLRLTVCLTDETAVLHFIVCCTVTQCPPNDPDFCALISTVTAFYHSLARAEHEFEQWRLSYAVSGVNLTMVKT